MPTKPPIHRPLGWKPAIRSLKRVDPFYRSDVHKAFRAAVLERDHYRCTDANCRTPGRGAGGRLIADHILARGAPGSTDHPSNGRTLCPSCDNRRHREKGLFAKG